MKLQKKSQEFLLKNIIKRPLSSLMWDAVQYDTKCEAKRLKLHGLERFFFERAVMWMVVGKVPGVTTTRPSALFTLAFEFQEANIPADSGLIMAELDYLYLLDDMHSYTTLWPSAAATPKITNFLEQDGFLDRGFDATLEKIIGQYLER